MLFKNKICGKCGNSYDVAFEKCPVCDTPDSEFKNYNIPSKICWLSAWQQIAIFLVGFAYGGFLAFELLYSGLFSNLENGLSVFLANCLTYVSCLLVFLAISFKRIKHVISHFTDWKKYLIGVGFAVVLFAGSYIISVITDQFGVETNENQSLINDFLLKYPVASFLAFGLIGPIVEEFTYRVGLHSFIRRLNKYAAIIITAIVFAFIHFSFTAENLANEFLNLPSYIFAGLVMSIAYEVAGPSCSITCHSLYNLATLVMLLMKLGAK